MKRIILIALALFSGLCSAQTFKVQNLDVLGTSTLTGAASFSVRPTFNGNTPWDSGNLNPASFVSSANPAFTGTATLNTAPLFPTAASNATLTALPSTTASTITRLGFYTPGDAPPLNYTASASACSLNSGAGDNGSQVATSDGKCWIANFPAGPIDVREFGAKGDNSTNNTTAMQAAFNTGRVVYYPCVLQPSIYQFTTISGSVGGIIGDGSTCSWLASTDTTSANDITFSAANLIPGQNAPVFHGFALIGAVGSGKASGAGLIITAPTSENQGAQIYDVTIDSFPTDLQFGAASNWCIQNSKFLNYLTAGVLVANTNNPDSGDSVIMGSFIGTAAASGARLGIEYVSSGGLKVIGNKINGGSYGIFLGLNAPSSTSDLLINGNSIENQATAAVELSRSSGSANFSNIEIVGNQMSINPNGVITDASGAFGFLTIDGNIIGLSSSTGTAIGLSNVANFIVGNNVLAGQAGSSVGIAVTSSSSNGIISPNVYQGLGTNINNASGSTIVVTVP
jgi:hypothetical protein